MKINLNQSDSGRCPNSRPASNQLPDSSAIDLDEINCIMNPLDGELIDRTDVDGLCELMLKLEPLSKKLYAVLCEIRRSLADLSEGDAATRRVRGKQHIAKIELPAVKFEQSVLKALWESHPELAHEFMRIDSIGVKMTEYKKLEGTASDDPAFIYFRDTMTNANQGRQGLPTVKIEK